MLASKPPELFNGTMDTKTPHTPMVHGLGTDRPHPDPIPPDRAPSHAPQSRSRRSEPAQDSGIVDWMMAYRDWWNLPARRKGGRASEKARPVGSTSRRRAPNR